MYRTMEPMKVERVVLDSNVLISSAISPAGKPFACLKWALDHATLIASRGLIEEVETRLARAKFAKYITKSSAGRLSPTSRWP